MASRARAHGEGGYAVTRRRAVSAAAVNDAAPSRLEPVDSDADDAGPDVRAHDGAGLAAGPAENPRPMAVERPSTTMARRPVCSSLAAASRACAAVSDRSPESTTQTMSSGCGARPSPETAVNAAAKAAAEGGEVETRVFAPMAW